MQSLVDTYDEISYQLEERAERVDETHLGRVRARAHRRKLKARQLGITDEDRLAQFKLDVEELWLDFKDGLRGLFARSRP